MGGSNGSESCDGLVCAHEAVPLLYVRWVFLVSPSASTGIVLPYGHVNQQLTRHMETQRERSKGQQASRSVKRRHDHAW